IYRTALWQLRVLLCSASSPERHSLLWGSCSSGRGFASGFLQIPPHDGHPCLWLTGWCCLARSGLSPPSQRPCRAHRNRAGGCSAGPKSCRSSVRSRRCRRTWGRRQRWPYGRTGRRRSWSPRSGC
ncbi:MAG: hypothetical protein CWE10_18620, partial [Symbiobacterium thermophilum]|nr:hypothetical protein [Symbiobacterium thermophilum]